jgi:hypothetical protein
MGAIPGKFCEKTCTDIRASGAAACGAGFKCDASCNGATPNPGLCFLAGTLTTGAACTSLSDCAAGYSCISSVCRQTCITNTDCATGTCVSIFCGGGTVQTNFKFCQ